MIFFLWARSGEASVGDKFLGTLDGGGGDSFRAFVGVSLKFPAGEDRGDGRVCVGELLCERHINLPVNPCIFINIKSKG